MAHLLDLPQGWKLWRWACLRGAGFAVDEVLRLGAPEAAACAERLLELEEAAAGRRAQAIAALERALPTLDEPGRKPARRLLKRLRAGAAPDPAEFHGEVRQPLVALAQAQAQVDAAAAELAQAFERERRRWSALLRQVARSTRFREAVVWQNRAALHSALDVLLRQPEQASDSSTRRHEATVARYLQRYATKNDTIGFFGPVGWAELTDGPEPLVLAPGPALLARRTVYFEHWGIDALATKLAEDPDLLPHLGPRRMPALRLEGQVLVHSAGRRTEIPPEWARLLAACDGRRSARTVARELAADRTLGLSEEEVFALLAELCGRGLVTWTLEIPTATQHPERALRALLQPLEAGPGRTRALAALDEIEGTRDAVAAAAGDPSALDQALAAHEAVFSRLTGQAGIRQAGQSYAGRTLLYEDCRRDLRMELGGPFLARLGPPLALVLASARWFSHEIALRYRAALLALYRRRCAETGSVVLDYLQLERDLRGLFPGGAEATSLVGQVTALLQARWAEILGLDAARPRLTRSVGELRGAVERAFAAPAPGWPAARHHSPDVLLAARGREALARGEYTLVLGEIHAGLNTVTLPFLVEQHPHPDVLVRARETDLPLACIAPVWSKARTRSDFYSLSRHDLDLERTETVSARPRNQVVATGDLVVEERDGRLVVRSRDGGRCFDILAFLEQHLIAESYSELTLLGPAPHAPRVTIDDLVVSRERWSFAAADIPFARAGAPLDRFREARRFARQHGLPRFVFLKVPEELKPCYLDLASPIYVDVAAGLIRKARAVTLTEMLPAPDETWLPDASGGRVTAELRLAALDPEPWGG